MEFELYFAVKENDLAAVKNLFVLCGKIDPSIRPYGQSLLLHAILNGSKEVAEYLIENGFDVNEKDSNGYAPLHGAAEKNDVSLITLLAKSGANPNVRDTRGNTPLSVAIYRAGEDVAAVKALVDAGADYKENIYGNVDVLGMAEQFDKKILVDYFKSIMR